MSVQHHKELHSHYDHTRHVPGVPDSRCGQAEVQVGEGGRFEHVHQDEHQVGNVDQWQTNVRRSAPEEGTGGSQNNFVSIRSTVITDKSNIL